MAVTKARIMCFDIEATNLSADCGSVLCFGYKYLDKPKTTVLKIRDYPGWEKKPWDDSRLLKDITKVMAEADLWVGWYSTRYDVPFLQTRILINNAHNKNKKKIPQLPNINHTDAWFLARKKLKFCSNRLENVSRALFPSDGSGAQKTKMSPLQWQMAAAGHIPSLKYVEEHCYQDILVLEQCYLPMRPFGFSTVNLTKIHSRHDTGCPVCTSEKVQQRGIRVTAQGRQARMWCRDCDHWYQVTAKERDVA